MGMHIGHVALQVTDLARSVDHASRTFGLRTTAQDEGEALLTANEKHHELQLLASDRAGLDHIGLEVGSDAELEAVRDRLAADGCKILSERAEESGVGSAIRAQGPAGICFEIYTAMEREPLSVDNVVLPLARRMGHVTLYTEEKPECERFILDVLGFRLSDRWGDLATWLRCDPDHHGIALGRTETGNRLHHYAFQLEGWAEIGAFGDHIARDHQEFIWGPGRHGPGFNLFTYLIDPDGTVVEAYADLLRIDNDAAYVPIDWEGDPRALNLWGPGMPDGWDQLGTPVLSPR